MNNGEESGVLNSSAGRRFHNDIHDGPSVDSGTRGVRGRGHGRGRGRGKSGGGMDIVPGNEVKARNSMRSSSETRLPLDCVQLQHHDSGKESASSLSQQYHHQNSGPLPSSFQEATRPEDEAPRDTHRRSNSKCVCVCACVRASERARGERAS